VRGQTRLSSGYYDAVDRTRAGSYQGSFHRSEAQVTYKFPDEHWTTNFWIRNIENDAQITNSGPNQRVYINDPRTYGINVSAKF
jgi:outer membrane receptor protein involved in Fe transport